MGRNVSKGVTFRRQHGSGAGQRTMGGNLQNFSFYVRTPCERVRNDALSASCTGDPVFGVSSVWAWRKGRSTAEARRGGGQGRVFGPGGFQKSEEARLSRRLAAFLH